jgi:hypothetical protein
VWALTCVQESNLRLSRNNSPVCDHTVLTNSESPINLKEMRIEIISKAMWMREKPAELHFA